jgi:hypothetical protein
MDPKEPVDLPDPVCEKHDNPVFPCPDCARAERLEDRLLFAVPFVLFVGVGIYVWLAR